jgi:hypothetical protein
MGDAIGAGLIDELCKKELGKEKEQVEFEGDIESSFLVSQQPSTSDGNLSNNSPDFEALGVRTGIPV